MRHWCFCHNTRVKDGDSPWARRHQAANYEGLRIPFFAKVRFLPSPTSTNMESRWNPPPVDGVFLGWKLNPGADASLGEYYVIALSDFAGKCLHRNARALDMKVHVQTVRVISEPVEYVFPLKQKYDWFNGELEGIETALSMDPSIIRKRTRSRKERSTG